MGKNGEKLYLLLFLLILDTKEYYDDLMKDKNIWKPYYKEISNDDSLKPTKSSYRVMSMIKNIIDRIKYIQDVDLQRKICSTTIFPILQDYLDKVHT